MLMPRPAFLWHNYRFKKKADLTRECWNVVLNLSIENLYQYNEAFYGHPTRQINKYQSSYILGPSVKSISLIIFLLLLLNDINNLLRFPV